MSPEDILIQDLIERFKIAPDKIANTRVRRIFAEVDQAKFEDIFAYAKNELKFTHLVSITGFDDGDTLSFMYHLAQERGVLLNIKIRVPKSAPVIKTVTGYFPGADAYEREVVDLFGAKVDGLPQGNRYPLPDDWPAGQYPLRKDWKPTA